MNIRIPRITNWAASIAVSLGFTLVQGAAPFGASVTRPDPHLPIATDGNRVFAVAADRQTLLVSDPGKSEWAPVATIPGAEIRGLAWAGNRLYFTNRADSSVGSVATVGGDKSVTIVHRGPPLVKPTELTYSGALLVSDPGAGVLFSLPTIGMRGSSTRPTGPTPIRADVKVSESTFLTGWGDIEVLISDSESGLLAQITDLTSESAKYRPMQQRGSGDAAVPWLQQGERPETVRRRGYPGVNAPGAIAVYNGILYTIDLRSGSLFTAGIHDARAVRLPMPVPGVAFRRLVANPVSLTALDIKTGRLIRWPRVIPSELTLRPGARPQSLLPVLEYLHKRKLLATKELAIVDNIDETLKNARMTWPVRGAPAEPHSEVEHYGSFCMLNQGMCANGLPRRDLAPGTPIVLADLYAERYTTATHVDLDGSETLGQYVDAAITSEEFKSQTSEEHLRRLNGVLKDDPRQLRDQTQGGYRISQELVRYVIPIEATELRSPDTEFARLVERVRKTIRIAPLERVPTSTAASLRVAAMPAPGDIPHDPQHPNDASCTSARTANAKLLETIEYVKGALTRAVFVGVAESTFDVDHRDFVDGSGASVLYRLGEQRDLVEVPPPVLGPAPPDREPVTWRTYEPSDHGTAVAAIIAGRSRPYDTTGLTRSRVGMFTSTDDVPKLADEIDRALNQSAMTVLNLSLRYSREVLKMRTLMEETRDVALFVVAAPNSSGQVKLCENREVWYPACHGQTPENVNILVVGGTTLDGKLIHPRSPIGKSVHLYAPSMGYFSAGRNNGYVAVEGTSFATALVSAAAAMLSSAGVKSPALIRNRLIATATVIEMADRPQWARRLNIRRALTLYQHPVLVDAATKQDQPVSFVGAEPVFTFKTAQGNRTIAVPLSHIRRLKRAETDQNLFELAYVAGEGLRQLQLELVRASDTPWEACYVPLDPQGQPAGPRRCTDLSELYDYVGPIE